MDYYETLGVSRTATADDIKRAYRKLASQHHPDKGGDKNKFQEIEQAYRTLSDDQKRSEYDNPQPQGFHFGGGPAGFEDLFRHGSPFGDIFGFRQARPQVNRSLQLQTTITLEDAFYGKELLATVRLPSGKEQTVNIKIPPGIHEGTTLRLSGMGDDSIPQLPRGDILLAVHTTNHAIFKRQGDDLLVEHGISCVDAMVGSTLTVTGIDGKQLETNIPAGIQHDALLSLTGHGMPNFNVPTRRGRLLIRIKLFVPPLSEDQKDNLRKLNII